MIGAKGLLDQYLLYFLLEQTNSSTDIIIGYRSANTATTYSAFHFEEFWYFQLKNEHWFPDFFFMGVEKKNFYNSGDY